MKCPWVAMKFDAITSLDQSSHHLDIFIYEEICITDIDEDLWKSSEILRMERRGVRVHLLRRMVFTEVPTPTVDVRRAVPCTKVEDAMCRGE